MARKSYQKGRIEQRPRKNGLVYVLRYRLREGGVWRERTEELVNDRGHPCKAQTGRAVTQEARRAADRRMIEINDLNNGALASIKRSRTVAEVTPQTMTVSEFVGGLWQYHKRKVKASTAYHYDSLMKLYILPAFGAKPLVEIGPQEVTLFLGKLDQKSLSGPYKQVIYQLLNTLFETAVAHDLIERSPLRRKIHRPVAERKEKPALTADQIRSVIEAVEAEYRALFVCVALTGLRIGELLGLRWRDLNFEERTLKVSRSLWRSQLMTPKTKGSRRTLHVPAALLEALEMHRQVSRWRAEDDFVFAKADGAPGNADMLRKNVLYPALEAVGIQRQPNSHGFHLFRHSAASIVHEQTRDVSLAQRLLGHSRLSTTADIYTHMRPEAEEATETLAREIWRNCGLTVAGSSERVN